MTEEKPTLPCVYTDPQTGTEYYLNPSSPIGIYISGGDMRSFKPLNVRNLPPILAQGTELYTPPHMYYGYPLPEDTTVLFLRNLAVKFGLEGRGGPDRFGVQPVLGVKEYPVRLLVLEGNVRKLWNMTQDIINEVEAEMKGEKPKWYLSDMCSQWREVECEITLDDSISDSDPHSESESESD